MTDIILLDSGPLGLVTNPKSNPENLACKAWLEERLDAGCRVIIPAIVDYEVRRELIRAQKSAGLERLDAFCSNLEFLSLTDEALRRAAELWAIARSQGRPAAGPDVLDADMILAAHALTLNEPAMVIATTNIGHLVRFTAADHWRNVA